MRNLNRIWHPWEGETIEYFTLGDLWGIYDEWSAYGASALIALNNEETVVQYYVPYLSVIQIYTSTRSSANLWSFREDSEMGNFEARASSSVSGSEESKSHKLWKWDGGSYKDCWFERESLWHLSDRLGYLCFQYFERSTPYERVPLMDKFVQLRIAIINDFKSIEGDRAMGPQVQVLNVYPAKLQATTFMNMVGFLQSANFGLILTRGEGAPWRLKCDLQLWSILYTGVTASAFMFWLVSWAVAWKGPAYPSMFNPLASIFVVPVMGKGSGNQGA